MMLRINDLFPETQCSKWAGICRCTIPELIFVPEFHTGSYQYILYAFIFSVSITAYPCFAFEKFTVAKVSFRALLKHHITGRRCRVVNTPSYSGGPAKSRPEDRIS
jgi:hypothetical protein